MEFLDRTKIIEKQKQAEGINFPKIVAIGGGTGLSTLLRGLKRYEADITAVVTVADNGGSSGMLREDLKMLPPGDIRNCILALADTEPLMFDLMNHRFSKEKGRLSGQNFGNLFIAAMTEVSGSFYEGIRNMSAVLAVKGKVLPVSLENINIGAKLSDGSSILGEYEIGSRTDYRGKDITGLFMAPIGARALADACEEIRKADILVVGPGSLYTSILPNFLFEEVVKAVNECKGVKIYVANIMTQPSETYRYSVEKHIKALEEILKTGYEKVFDYCIVNNQLPEPEIINKYFMGDADMVDYDIEQLKKSVSKVIEAKLVKINRHGAIRHNKDLLAEIVMHIWANHTA